MQVAAPVKCWPLSLVFRRRHAEVLAGLGKRSCLQEWGFAQEWSERDCPDSWAVDVHRAYVSNWDSERDTGLAAHSKLRVYSSLGHPDVPCVAKYLDDSSKRASRFLTKSLDADGHRCKIAQVAPGRGSLCSVRSWRSGGRAPFSTELRCTLAVQRAYAAGAEGQTGLRS